MTAAFRGRALAPSKVKKMAKDAQGMDETKGWA